MPLRILINGAKGRMGHALAAATSELGLTVSAALDADSFIPTFHLTFQPMGPFSSPEWNDDNTEVSLPIAFGGDQIMQQQSDQQRYQDNSSNEGNVVQILQSQRDRFKLRASDLEIEKDVLKRQVDAFKVLGVE
jgi:hypothetical protein